MSVEAHRSIAGETGETPEESALARVLESYLAGLEAGRPADPDRLIADHPELAGPLRACLRVMHLAAGLSGSTDPGGGSPSWRPGDSATPRILPEPPGEESPIVRAAADLPDGPSMSRYQILGEIARGGMGVVLKARDAELGRDLAMKVLQSRHRGDPDVVGRFVEEARIGGQLQHPGIVPVHELGSLADRRPYFTMKLVKGRTLSAMLAERAGPHDDVPRFLTVFEQVCQTLAYAHARRVIHRDLKPANVMVGSFGEVQVVDWGLAKVLHDGGVADEARAIALAETAITTGRSGPSGGGESQPGSVLGTPSYMAPEQARGELDHVDERADVFGLGAVLCEVLTGRPPFVGSTRQAIQAMAARGQTADALGRLDTCDADAELIALARDCLAAEAESRPRDAGEVARRISAYRSAVQDRLRAAELARVEAQTRAEEERKRRRLTVALAASVLGIAGLIGGGWAYLARQRTERLLATTRVVTEALAEAERLRGQAQSAAVDLTKWAEALAAARRARDLLAAGESDEALRARVAEAERERRLLDELEAIRTDRSEHGDRNRLDARYAAAFRAFGIDVDRLDPEEAGRQIARRPRPTAVQVAAHLDNWAWQRRWARDDKDDASWHRLLAAARAADPDPWRAAVRGRIIRGDLEALRKLADDLKALEVQPVHGLIMLALALKNLGDPGRGQEVVRRAWRLYPGDFWANFERGRAEGGWGRHLRPDEAVRCYSAAVALRPRSFLARNNLGGALHAQGKPDDAIAEYREAIRLKPDDGRPHNNIGAILAEQGKLDEAIAEYREAIRLEPDSQLAHSNLGHSLVKQEKLDEAIAEFREALRLKPLDPTGHFDHNPVATLRCDLGDALSRQGKLDDAIAEYREALRLKPDLARAHANLGNDLRRRGKWDEATAELREAIRLKPDLAAAHVTLGAVLGGEGKLDEATAEFREALRLDPNDAVAHCNYGQALRTQGRYADALAELRRGHELGSKRPDWRYPSARLVDEVARLVELERKLPPVLAGRARPADAAEALGLALLCYEKRLHGASARLWSEAFRARSELIDDMQAQHRYNAACAAALAGCGAGRDDPPLDDAARARWRQQAIDWLKSDLTAWSKILPGRPPQSRAVVAQTLRHWKADPDLAGLRDPASIAGLPKDEQAACHALWKDVDALLAKAEGRDR